MVDGEEKKFSILVCTYNGSTRLEQTLKHLSLLNTAELNVELIVVDNASTDGTGSKSKEYWRFLGAPFKLTVLEQAVPGKSHALSLAIKQATGKYLIICDDDNWLSPDYFQLAFSIMEQNPDFGIVGGRAEAVADTPLPSWFYEVQYAYACGAPSTISKDFTGTQFLWGAGMVIRKTVADKILNAAFPTLLTGRKGNLLTAGEDDEKCVRTWLLGYKTYYENQLVIKHYIPVSRLTLEYKESLVAGFTEQGPIINSYRRLYQIVNQRNKFTQFIKQFTAYCLWCITANSTKKKIAADFLFFLTKAKPWKNEINANVWKYYRDVCLPQKLIH